MFYFFLILKKIKFVKFEKKKFNYIHEFYY